MCAATVAARLRASKYTTFDGATSKEGEAQEAELQPTTEMSDVPNAVQRA